MKFLIGLFVVSILAIPTLLIGQDEVRQPIQPTVAYATVNANGNLIEVAPSGLSSLSGGYMNLLLDPSVKKDLELVDDQLVELASVRKAFQDKLQRRRRELFGAKQANDTPRVNVISQSVKDLEKKFHQAMSDKLLPQQLERLKQINYQMEVKRYGGTTNALRQGKLSEALGITKEQLKKITEIQKKMHSDFAEKLKEIQESAKTETMKVLTAHQKRMLKELTGEELLRKPEDWKQLRNNAPEGR